MREGKLAIFLGSALTLLSAAAHAGPPPKELFGKSIMVTWTEHRSQRHLDQANFQDVDMPLSRKFYISTKGNCLAVSLPCRLGAVRVGPKPLAPAERPTQVVRAKCNLAAEP
jgi:hypothetical protein